MMLLEGGWKDALSEFLERSLENGGNSKSKIEQVAGRFARHGQKGTILRLWGKLKSGAVFVTMVK